MTASATFAPHQSCGGNETRNLSIIKDIKVMKVEDVEGNHHALEEKHKASWRHIAHTHAHTHTHTHTRFNWNNFAKTIQNTT